MLPPPAANEKQPAPDYSTPTEPRRGFVKQFLAIVIGGLVGVVPLAVGAATFLNPLRKSVKEKQRPTGSDQDGFFDVAPLNSITAAPQAFKIVADRKDAWNTFPDEAIGAVFLQRAAGDELRAFNSSCPHAGCRVDFRPAEQVYHCPCHNSTFGDDGHRDPKSPSARDLDALDVKVLDGRVWVKFQNFKGGDKQKKPV